MSFLKTKVFSLFFLFLFLCLQDFVGAVRILDISETSFAKGNIKFLSQEKYSPLCLRIVSFDVESQTFGPLYYFLAPVSGKHFSTSLSKTILGVDLEYWNSGEKIQGLLKNLPPLSKDLWIILPETFLKFLRPTKYFEVLPLKGEKVGRVLLRNKGEKFKEPKDLIGHLKKFEFQEKRRGKTLLVTFCLEEEGLKTTIPLFGEKKGLGRAQGYKKELGFLGEFATDCTFLAYGFLKLPSKLSSDNGIDGVFLSKNPTDSKDSFSQLWISESKCLGKPLPLDKILSILRDKLRSDKTLGKTKFSKNPHVQKTAQLIYSFMDKSPRHFFLLAQRVLGDGRVHSKIERFNKILFKELEKNAAPVKKRTPPIFKDLSLF